MVHAIFATLFLTINEFFSTKLEKKDNFVSSHPASRPDHQFSNIPFLTTTLPGSEPQNLIMKRYFPKYL